MMIAIALIAGLVAVMLASRWLTERSSMATSKVAVAAVDLNLGQRITPQNARLIDWPSGSIPAGALTSLEALEGRVTKVSLQRDEPILETKLAPKGTTGGLSAFIAEGKRAITVRVNDVVGVAGFALPGNYVDIVVNTVEDKAGKSATVSKIVMEKILVLAIAQETSRDDTKPKVVNAVTLEVTPQEAEAIDLARSVGTLSLVLRNQIDSAPSKTAGATKDSLLERPSDKPAPQAAAPKPAAAPQKQKPVQTCIDTLVGPNRVSECY